MLFVGRKGAGKTANMLEAGVSPERRREKHGCRHQTSVLRVHRFGCAPGKLPGELKDYFIEALWSFLLQSEIARSAVVAIEARPVGVPYSEAERDLIRLSTSPHSIFVTNSPVVSKTRFSTC